MPIINSVDSIGPYYKFGKTGHKYYYYTINGRKVALAKAKLQARAIEWRKHT